MRERARIGGPSSIDREDPFGERTRCLQLLDDVSNLSLEARSVLRATFDDEGDRTIVEDDPFSFDQEELGRWLHPVEVDRVGLSDISNNEAMAQKVSPHP